MDASQAQEDLLFGAVPGGGTSFEEVGQAGGKALNHR